MIEITLLDIFYIPFILLFGIATSYYDCKYRKIKNSWIAAALIYSVVALIILINIYESQGGEVSTEYIKLFFQNLAISLAFGVMLWMCNLWSAGDAKLFLAYSALIPLTTYKWGAIGLFPSYILLINTFTPLLFFLLIKVLVSLKPKDIFEEFLHTLNPKSIASFSLFIFGFSFLNEILFKFFGNTQNSAITNVLVLFIFLILLKRLNVNYAIIGAILSILRIIFSFNSIFRISFFINFLFQLVLFVLLRYFIINLGNKAFSKQIFIESLEPGMCLAEDVIFEKGKYTKELMRPGISFFNSILNTISKTKSIFSNSFCLTNADIIKIKRLHSSGKLKEHAIYIYEKIYFALFMFIGVLLTLIFRGDLLMSVRKIIESFI
ncbi:MAG: A24 family peptidase C-terminal domain-containing protein [archaeon]